MKLAELTPPELLPLHAKLADRLRTRGIGSDGARYQIKGGRITRSNNSRQLSAIRDLGGGHFDFLPGVLFNEDTTLSCPPREYRVQSRLTGLDSWSAHGWNL